MNVVLFSRQVLTTMGMWFKEPINHDSFDRFRDKLEAEEYIRAVSLNKDEDSKTVLITIDIQEETGGPRNIFGAIELFNKYAVEFLDVQLVQGAIRPLRKEDLH